MKRIVGVSTAALLNLDISWGWVVNFKPRQLYQRQGYPVPLVQMAGWGPGPVIVITLFGRQKKPSYVSAFAFMKSAVFWYATSCSVVQSY